MATATEQRPWLPAVRNPIERVVAAVAGKRPIAFAMLYTAIACTFVITSEHLADAQRWGVLVLMPLGLILANWPAGRMVFMAGTAVLVWALIADWYVIANHGFIITYFAVFLSLIWVSREDFWHHGEFFAQSILMLLMGFAFLQKLLSSYYMSGNQFADLLIGGESYSLLIGLLDPASFATVLTASGALHALSLDYALQSASASVTLPEPELLLLVMIYGMTWASVGLQAGLEVAVIFRERCGIWLHRLLFVFTLTVYTLRPENVFLSLNLLMGYALTDERARAMRLPYVAVILYLLIAALTGFRPGWLR